MEEFDYSDRLPSSYQMIALGDFHVGNRSFDSTIVSRAKRWLRRGKHRFFFGLGDLIEGIAPINDKRFSLDSVDGKFAQIGAQIDYVVELLEGVAHQGLFHLDGNHEWKHSTFQIVETISKRLDMDYGTAVSIANCGPFNLYAWHGGKSVNSSVTDIKRKMTNEALGVKRILWGRHHGCECMIMGHIHKARICAPDEDKFPRFIGNGKDHKFITPELKKTYVGTNRHDNYVHQDQRWYASNGAALRHYGDGFSNYAEKAGYFPEPARWITIEVKNDQLVGMDYLDCD